MARAGRHGARAKALSLGWGEDTDPRAAPAPGSAASTSPLPDAAPDPSTSEKRHSGERPTGEPPSAEARRGRSPRAQRLLAIGLALALVVALAVGLPRQFSATDGPEKVATDFLQAIVDGDLEQVIAHVEDAPDASSAALTAEILGAASDRLVSFTIDDVDVSAGDATVTVTLDNGDRNSTARLDLTSRANSAFAPVGWELAPVHVPEFLIDVPLGAREIFINGVPLSVEDLVLSHDSFSRQIALQLLPGTYEVTVSDAGPWQDAPQVELEAPPVLGTWRKPIHDLQFDLDEAGVQEVQEQIETELAECMQSTSSLLEDCPFEVSSPDGGVLQSPESPGTWTLSGAPEYDVRPTEGFLWNVSGSATVEFTAADGDRVSTETPERARVDLESIAYIDPARDLRLEAGPMNGFGYTYCSDPVTGEIIGIAIMSAMSEWSDESDSCSAAD